MDSLLTCQKHSRLVQPKISHLSFPDDDDFSLFSGSGASLPQLLRLWAWKFKNVIFSFKLPNFILPIVYICLRRFQISLIDISKHQLLTKTCSKLLWALGLQWYSLVDMNAPCLFRWVNELNTSCEWPITWITSLPLINIPVFLGSDNNLLV